MPALMFLLLLLIPVAAHADRSWDFENNALPNPPDNPNNVVPAQVLTEPSGNHFGRLTVTVNDCRTPGDAIWDPCPKIREQVVLGTLPEVAGQDRTFSFRLRLPSGAGQPTTGHDVFYWQIIEPNATGTNQFQRSFWLGIHDFGAGPRMFLANRVPPCPGSCITFQGGAAASVIDLGPPVFDQWATYRISMRLAVTPTNGTVTVCKNNVLIASVSNQPTMFLVDTQDVKMDVLDWVGTPGMADFDDLTAQTGIVGACGTSAPPSPPTNLRVN